ncbi:MAG: recombination mediator RecR [Aquificaceae bacterium]
MQENSKAIPEVLDRAFKLCGNIPLFGTRSTSRLIYGLLKLPKEQSLEIVKALEEAILNLRKCVKCGLFTVDEVCFICKDPLRNRLQICVVEESQDAFLIERLGKYRGLYHILEGRIAPLEGISPSDLSIDKLFERIETLGSKELILATNPNLEGEATANYIAKLAKRRFKELKITRISHGLQFGSLIESSDPFSLESSIVNRKELRD